MPEPDSLAPLLEPQFAEAITQFAELLNRDHVAFLFGAGTSYIEGMPLMSELAAAALDSANLSSNSKEILSEVQRTFGVAYGNIEDYLSEIGDHLAIAERRDRRSGVLGTQVVGTKPYSQSDLAAALSEIKQAIANKINECAVPFQLAHHRKLVAALHAPLRPGKRIGRSVDYLLLNYDTFIEDALALEKVPYADGIEGGVNGWWRPEINFGRSDVTARVFKLHGSIDWWHVANDPLPRRLSSRVRKQSGDAAQLLIWPASTKYSESRKDPFAQLLQRAREVLTPHGSNTLFLSVAGYSFGDEHINAEIGNALRQSEGRLTVAVFTESDSLNGALLEWNLDSMISDSLLIFSRRGFFHGSLAEISATDLPWWKFENLTRIIAGER